MNETRSQDITLKALLAGIDLGNVVLPDFQRDFEWTDGDVRALMATVLMDWPVGGILLIEGSNNREYYAPRAFEGSSATPNNIIYIVLDGQQRLTSLYHALSGRGPLRYFLKIDEEANYGDVNSIDELLVSYSNEAAYLFNSPEEQFAKGLLPLTALASPNDFYEWRDQLASNSEDVSRVTDIYRRHFSHLANYRIPAIIIDSQIDPAAIARVFLRVNQGGMKLSTFDMMVAKTYSSNFNLRAEWEISKQENSALNRQLDDDGLPILSVISLLVLGDVRQSAVLKLSEDDVIKHWKSVASHYAFAIKFVEDEFGVINSDWLPYSQILTVLAAVSYHQDLRAMRNIIARWFWATGFGHRYDASSNSRAVSDYLKLSNSEEAFSEPLKIILEEFLESTRGKRGAVHKAYLCLLGSHISKQRLESNPSPTPRSIFKRVAGKPSLHLRTLTFNLLDEDSKRLESFGMNSVSDKDYFDEAIQQIHKIATFLMNDSQLDVRIIKETDEQLI